MLVWPPGSKRILKQHTEGPSPVDETDKLEHKQNYIHLFSHQSVFI